MAGALPAAVLVAISFMVSTLASADLPCRNLKSAAQCDAEDAAAEKSRKAKAPDPATEVSIRDGVASMERITVTPEATDLPVSTKEKWEVFGAQIAAKPGSQEVHGNGGGWLVCVTEPPACKINCCTRHREFSVTGRNVGGLGAY